MTMEARPAMPQLAIQHKALQLGLSLCVLAALTVSAISQAADPADTNPIDRQVFRGPSDLVVLDGNLCVTANELTSTLSLVDLRSGSVLDEQECGERPMALAGLHSNELLVSCYRSGTVERYLVQDKKLKRLSQIRVGFEPLGLAVHGHGRTAYVGLQATGEVVQLSLPSTTRSTSDAMQIERRIEVGAWPRYLTLSADELRLAIGCSGEGMIAVHDTVSGEQLYTEPLSGGINIGHMLSSDDGLYAYFPWMVYRSNPITEANIQRGWVLASRLGRVRLDGPSYREAISLDVPRRAMADVHGIASNADQSRLVVTSAGTHELLVYRLEDLPFVGTGGPGDLIDGKLLRDNDLFKRIELGGRPLGVRNLDERRFVVANHTLDELQVVDIAEGQIVERISLGVSPQDEPALLVHRGRQLFHDAAYSLDQWYSCASCHLDGGSNAKAMDTWNDGTELTPKTVLPLTAVTETGPWTWHGWQDDLRASIHKSFTETMLGPPMSEADVTAMEHYLATLTTTASPFRSEGGGLTEAAERGSKLFHSDAVGCANCHSGPNFTDGEVHDVGLGSTDDKYQGYNTPTLLGVYRKVRFLHDGRAKTLERLLTKHHRSDEIGGGHMLTAEEMSDLVEYLKSL